MRQPWDTKGNRTHQWGLTMITIFAIVLGFALVITAMRACSQAWGYSPAFRRIQLKDAEIPAEEVEC